MPMVSIVLNYRINDENKRLARQGEKACVIEQGIENDSRDDERHDGRAEGERQPPEGKEDEEPPRGKYRSGTELECKALLRQRPRDRDDKKRESDEGPVTRGQGRLKGILFEISDDHKPERREQVDRHTVAQSVRDDIEMRTFGAVDSPVAHPPRLAVFGEAGRPHIGELAPYGRERADESAERLTIDEE